MLRMTFLPYTFKYRITAGVLKLNKKSMNYPPLDEMLEAKLRQEFKDDVLDLEKLTGRTLKDWLPKGRL